MKSVLIIKTGRSESFAETEALGASLGDVLRSTVLLHLFKDSEVTWVTSSEAAPLLSNNSLIQSLLLEGAPEALGRGTYDVVLNLEKASRWIDLMKTLRAKEKYGFVDTLGSWVCPVENKLNAPLNLEIEKIHWSEGLYRLMGRQWQGEEYFFSPPIPISDEISVEFGLNWAVGPKWPSKYWDKKNWEILYNRLSTQYTVSWQRGFNSLSEYIYWISQCETLVTTDSLGLHLAIALKKRTFAIFGPTSAHQVHLYSRGVSMSPDIGKFPCSPCHDPVCVQQISCMEALSADQCERQLFNFLNHF